MEFTILTASPGMKCTKVYAADGSLASSYDNVKTWSVAEATAPGLDALAGLLRSIEPNQAIIRGRFIGMNPDGVRRVMHPQYNKDTGELECAPQFVAVDRSWVCIDIDGAPAKAGAPTVLKPEWLPKVAEWVRDTYLPPEFHGVACVYQWSSSAGVPDWSRMALHLWFELSRPMYAAGTFRDDLVPYDYVDHRLCNAVQVHYVAAPIFQGGDDPLGRRRIGVLDGSPAPEMRDTWTDKATYDAWIEENERRRAERRAQTMGEVKTKSFSQNHYADRASDRALENIKFAAEGVRHDTIYLESHNMGQLIGGGYLQRHDIEGALVLAAEDLFDEPARRQDCARIVADGIESGIRKPRDLSHVGERSTPPPRQKEKAPAPSLEHIGEWLAKPPDDVPEPEPEPAPTVVPHAEIAYPSASDADTLRLIGAGLREYGADIKRWPSVMYEAARRAMELAE